MFKGAERPMAGESDAVSASQISLPLGLVVEKRKSTHRWGNWIWRPVAVIPGARAGVEWHEMMSGEGWTRYHLATLPLTLHRKETEAYLSNLLSGEPVIYAVLRPVDPANAERPVKAHLVTASPYAAQDHTDNDTDIVEKVSMPEPVIAWVRAFAETHHKEEAFKKRRRDRLDLEEQKFGKEPIFKPGRRPEEGLDS